MTGPGEVCVVLPGNVDDPALPSGGNTYDRRVCQVLAADGWSVAQHAVPGTWPLPVPADQHALAGALAAVPDGAPVLLDGLVGCAAPEVVVPQSRRLRVILLVHLPLADETGLAAEVANDLGARELRVVHAAAEVVATSHWAARRVAQVHGLPADRVHVAAPGVDPAPRSAGTDGRSRLLCVASITPRKGQDVLVEALASVANRSLWCVCVGAVRRTPGYVQRVRRSVRGRGLADRVRIAGPVSDAELAAAYDEADLVVLPSRGETYGMVVTEALARGIPVVATDVGGVPEALGRAADGTPPGMLVPPADPAALAACLQSWSDDPGLRHRLRAAATSRRATLPGWQHTAQALAAVLQKAGTTAGKAR
jgi:glycosyltransferase involved in cell wall biosynthesis